MSDDDRWSDPPPVAEYRDPELVRRFEVDPVPGHRPGFWSELEGQLLGRTDSPFDAGPEPRITDRPDPFPTAPARPSDATTGGPVAPIDDGGPDAGLRADGSPPPVVLATRPSPTEGGGAGRWLALAAGLLVVGLGAAALLARSGSSSSVESATPSASTAAGASSTSPSTAVAPSTTDSAPLATSTTTVASTRPTEVPTTEAAIDYFDGDAQVRSIGPGEAVGFSPDGSAVLVLDDAPGPELGCEGAERLALYTQDLATGQRRPTVDGAPTVETGGLELAISPFTDTPDGVATRPVYWRESCDGQAGPVMRGVLSSDGSITLSEPLAPGEPDPFAETAVGVVSPDRANAVVVADGAATVVELDDEGRRRPGGRAVAPPAAVGEIEVTRAVWSPAGDVVALGAQDGVVVWNPWTGEHQRFPNGTTVGLAFDGAGARLAVVSWDDGLRSSILTFGDLPEPATAPARCSGRVDLDPLTATDLTAAEIPGPVAATAVAIDRAAADCDWGALAELTSEGFVASFGGDEPIALWQQQEAVGGSPMWYLRSLLRQPHAVDPALEDSADPPRYVWPSFHLDEDCSFDDVDRATLTALGYDADRVAAECGEIGGYLGYRTAIDEKGRWRFFVAGD